MGEEVLGGLAGALGLPRHEGAELRVRVDLLTFFKRDLKNIATLVDEFF